MTARTPHSRPDAGVECPVCRAPLQIRITLAGAAADCDACGATLASTSANPAALAIAPHFDDRWRN